MKLNLINTEPSDTSILPVAKEKFYDLAKKLHSVGFINKYSVDDSNGIGFTLYRKPDNKVLYIEIGPEGEVMYEVFDQVYRSITAEHEMDGKLSVLEGILNSIQYLMKNRELYEEFYALGGKIVFRRLVYPDGYRKSVSTVPFGSLIRFLSSKKIVYPKLSKEKV